MHACMHAYIHTDRQTETYIDTYKNGQNIPTKNFCVGGGSGKYYES